MKPLIHLYAAGSLRRAFLPLLHAFSQRYGIDIASTFGPAGLLSERIIRGETADIFACANCAHPLRLKTLGLAEETALFTRNQLCIVMRNIPELTNQPWLMALRDPRFIISTSTPGSDPGGDYAVQLFERIEHLHYGWGEELRKRSRALVGGPTSTAVPDGMTAGSWLIRSGQADIHIGYASYIPLLIDQPDLHILQLPAPYRIDADYMLALIKPSRHETRLLADYIQSPEGQGFLLDNGFTPLL